LPETLGPAWRSLIMTTTLAGYFFGDGTDWPRHAGKRSTPKLYHNNTMDVYDVTHQAGLDVEMFGLARP